MGSLYIEAQGYVPVLLENLRGMSYSGTCWPLGGAWFQCRYGGFRMSCLLVFPGIRSSLLFSRFGVKPPASGFQSHSYSSLKTSPSVISKAVPSVCFSFFCLVCWAFILFLYLLSIPCLFILFILLCLVWPFCILAVCGVLFIVEFPHCGWGCMGSLPRFLG